LQCSSVTGPSGYELERSSERERVCVCACVLQCSSVTGPSGYELERSSERESVCVRACCSAALSRGPLGTSWSAVVRERECVCVCVCVLQCSSVTGPSGYELERSSERVCVCVCVPWTSRYKLQVISVLSLVKFRIGQRHMLVFAGTLPNIRSNTM